MSTLTGRLKLFQQHHSEFLTILLLFTLFRLMMLMAYAPPCLLYCSDYLFYFNVIDLSRQGLYPFLHFWYEFPPVFPYLNLVAYRLAGGVYQNYVSWLGTFLLLADAGNLALLYWLGARLYDRSYAAKLCWIYSLLFAPLYIWRSTFDSLTTFFILLTLYLLVAKRYRLMGLALGVGVMVKYIPIILLPAIWRAAGWRRMVQAFLLAAVVVLGVFGPFFVLSPRYTLASVQAQARKSSWQTIWALIDGNYQTGSFGPVETRFDPAAATTPAHNPSRVPPVITLLVFGGIGLYIFTRPVRQSRERDALLFSALTMVIFFLWSKGWSPQWQIYLIPLLLLSLSVGEALLYIISLSLVNLVEWPVILGRDLTQFLPLTIILRTLIFVLLAVKLYQLLAGRQG
ncbi:MAG: DUF2029 domain-containing protein, partial [Chloroflexi bacterium]